MLINSLNKSDADRPNALNKLVRLFLSIYNKKNYKILI